MDKNNKEETVESMEKQFGQINIEHKTTEDCQSTSRTATCSRCGSRPSKQGKYCEKCSTNVADGKITKKTTHGKAVPKFNKDNLPPEVLSKIMTFLAKTDLQTCVGVNRVFRQKAREELTTRSPEKTDDSTKD